MVSEGVSYYALSCPVLIGTHVKPRLYQIAGEIEGTCFAIGNDLFVTAAHVVRTVVASRKVGLVGVFDRRGAEMHVLEIKDTEELDGDVGLLKTEAIDPRAGEVVQPLPWREQRADTFDPVCSFGYAYGFFSGGTANTVLQRGFRGYIAASPVDFLPPGFRGSAFPTYELSFGAPRGLSGAPLVTDHERLEVLGIIIGNSQSRMLILQNEEIESTSGTITKYEQYESLVLGIATQTRAILDHESKLLGRSAREHLISMRLFHPTDPRHETQKG